MFQSVIFDDTLLLLLEKGDEILKFNIGGMENKLEKS